jgi:adenine-specific DNA-methyltransferase
VIEHLTPSKPVYVLGDSLTLVPDLCRELDQQQRKIDGIVTDPPYGVDFSSGFAQTAEGKKLTRKIENDGNVFEAIKMFHQIMNPLVERLADDADLYIFTSWAVIEHWKPAVNALPNVEVQNLLVWEKGWPGLGDLDANWPLSFELIIYAKKGRRLIRKRRPSILVYDRLSSGQNIHPMEKPVPLLKELIAQSTNEGDLLVDPWAGSASLLDAARQSRRNAVGFEKDKDHFKRAQSRLSAVGLLDLDL